MLLSVVTVTHHSARVLPGFFAALGDVPRELLEVVVVDSGSDDLAEVQRIAERHGATLAAVPENVGYGFGSDIGARLARGEWLAFVNPDVEIGAQDLLALVDFARARGLTLAGPTLRSRVGVAPPSARPLIEPLWRRPSWEFADDGEAVIAPSMSGCCMVVRADRFAAVGGFDPRFFMFAEETDLHLRLARAGDLAAVSRDVVALTEGGGSSEGVTSDWAFAQRCVSRVLYSFKNLSPVAGVADLCWRMLQLLGRRNRVAALRQLGGELVRARRLRHRDVDAYLGRALLQDRRGA